MRLTKNQIQTLTWLIGKTGPPKYAFGGLAPAIARLRAIGLISGNKITKIGLDELEKRKLISTTQNA
jgi:hypothetical protein